MASTPNSKTTGRSRDHRKNLYDRLEDARNRRAEVLAHKPAANDVARRPVEVPHDEPQSELARFPKIVMPSAVLPEAETKPPPKHRSQWPIAAFAGLIVVALLVVLLTLPSGIAPRPGAAVADLSSPLGDAGAASFATSTDVPVLQRQATRLSSTALPRALPPQDPAARQPQALVRVADARPPNEVNASEQFLTLESVIKLGQNSAFPLAPLTELPFNFDMPVTLRVSLNIPLQSRRSDINAVLSALDQSRHDVSTPRRVNFVIRDTQVRFFHKTDAPAAIKLAENIGGVARDFTDFSPAPPERLVEVYVAGRSDPAPPPRAPRGIAGDIQRLTEDIGNALRSITR